MSCTSHLSLQLSSSFYVYQVLRKLPNGAEKILKFMGYKATSHEMQELKYDGDVNTERVLETAADLVILHSELDLIKALIGDAIQASPHPARAANFFTLWNILDVRGRTDERYDATWKRLMKEAYKPQQETLYPPHGSSSGPSSDITCGGRAYNTNLPVTDVRRGSAPLLDQASVIHGGTVPVISSQSHFPSPAERYPGSTTRPPPSTNWGQIHSQPAPHQQYASTGSPAEPVLQSRNPPITVCEHGHLDTAACQWEQHQNLHQHAEQTGLAGSTVSQNKSPLNGCQPHHHHNIGTNTQMTTSSPGSQQMNTCRRGSEQTTIGGRCSEQTTIGRRGSEQTTIGGRCSEQTTIGRHGNEQTTIGGRGSEQTTIGRRGNEQVTIGRRGIEQTTVGRHGSEQTTVGRHGSEQMTTGGCGNEQIPPGGRGSEQTQNAGGNVYANISETLMKSDRGISTSQSSTAKHEHEQSQPAEPVWIPTKNPQLHSSEKSYSFQEKLQDLFQQFPGLVAGQEASSPPALVEGEETPNPTYQNIDNLLQSDVLPANQSQGSLSLNISELPEPVVQSEGELEQLAMHRQNRSGLMSINNLDIKDARSVRDESGFGPCYESLSIFSPDRSPAATPSTQVHREVEEAWKVHTSVKIPDSGSSNNEKKSPMPSLETTSLDDVKLQFPGGHPSPSSSGTEDIYNSSAGPSLESPKHKSAEESGGAAVEHETLTTAPTNPRVVADSGDTSPSPEPRQPLRRPLSHQSAVSYSDNKGPASSPPTEGGSSKKPIPRPRQKLQEMHKASKSLDNDLDEPKPPQPTPRGLVRTVKSTSDLQRLGERPLSGSQCLNVPSTQSEVPQEDEEQYNMTPGESQVVSHDMQTDRQNVDPLKLKPKPAPRRAVSVEAKNILSDDTTTNRESVMTQEGTMTVGGKENEFESPTSPLHVKTLAEVRQSNVMAHKPEQVPVRKNNTDESNLDFGGKRTQQKLNQRQGPSVAANIPSPSDLVVGQTDIPDPVVHGFWFCSYCTNLVSNTTSVCDVCGTDQEAV